MERKSGESDRAFEIPAIKRSTAKLLGVLGDVLTEARIRKASRVKEHLLGREPVARTAT
jgi:hypothetical protein